MDILKHFTKENIISYVLSFFLALSIIGLSVLLLGRYTVFSNHGIIHATDRINYYSGLCEEMEKMAYEMGMLYGISEEELDNVFTPEKIRTDIYKVVQAKIDDKEYNIDTVPIGESLIRNIKEVRVQAGEEWTDENQEALVTYIDNVAQMYKEKIVIPGLDYMVKGVHMFGKVMKIGIPVCVLVAIICCICLVVLREYFHQGLRQIIYGIFGAAFSLMIFFAAIIAEGSIYRINVSAEYLRKFFTYYAGYAMLMQIITGTFIAAAGAILVYIVFRSKGALEIDD